jgi:hypothetical protein
VTFAGKADEGHCRASGDPVTFVQRIPAQAGIQ